ncbi:pre-mRNA-splicing factor SYF1 [Phalaenopsis equestris]|uniref:pre-mRNA-splicing factor SYF1 n=1 Tax=Phalaenopsis equestris TaxID=78828 RepID=UPI0009E2772B|nr:pre-mRNA-splicing factor SYF1 [Phalaenopsis equestris]XP_020574451.1 pre-mRNA-splicing factor SYF1 [Phalaenopsis equestris]XP_020574452.1 pre-mRNA-splicing factor SYF1 [Phalaenopsis equestris]XP_020574453.1 pre-mRNA-splicing factor SYF1 [Phalaenopsis equestris]XP_020574454.1 pre-mRNA-splicing factor SYF1 [Phalaenopsis equestris]XP_020574455.1 pre-mRNA-splicing factor SYF1 [Phalaenopsis equestris]
MAEPSPSTSKEAMLMSSELYPSVDDLPYEEEILRNPFNLKLWWRYLIARADAPFDKRRVIYERALKALPGSYKLWHAYLRERLDRVRAFSISHDLYGQLNNTFERALVTMHKMPRIWIMYLTSLTEQRLITRARHTFDRALCALPVTQHDRIWSPYLTLVSISGVPVETSLRVYRRYLLFDPSHIEDFIDFLLRSQLWQEAAERLSSVLNDDSFHSIKGKTRHQLWLELCDLLTRHATEVSGLKVDAIIRGGIRKYTDEIGRLWTSLADYYVRRGLYEKARDVFEEGLANVVTVRDFSVIFDSYAQFEQSALAAKIETAENGSDGSDDDGDKNGIDKLSKKFLEDFWLNDDDDADLRLARLENLFDRRPELLNSVLLRQNPHNVEQWHRRVKLFEGNPTRQILTFTEAVRTVDPMKAVGKPHTLWVSFARLYENHNDLVNARVIFDKAVQVNYKTVDNLASVWCEWAEMELRHKNFQAALELMRRSTAEPSVEVKRRVAADGNEPVQMRLHKSLRLWSFYVDLEESLGTLESTRSVYERILDLRIATPQIVLNYAFLLEEHKYFEDAFKVYERGVKIFKFPHVKDIWVTYLSKFVKRYGKTKLERARELFEHAIEKAPAQDVKPLYLQYAKLEEDYGLAKRAMKVYDQAVKAVSDGEKLSMYEIYIARAAEIFGIPKTREIYEQAIESGLPDNAVKTMCMKYAELERNLGEIDRARAIFVFASQFADPRSDSDFWKRWNDFEVQHGNEDTFREMLRVKRSVLASFSQTHMILPEYLMQKDQKLNLEEAVDTLKRAGVPEDEMASLERQLASSSADLSVKDESRMMNFVSAGVESRPNNEKKVNANSEDIELPEESDSDDEKIEIAQKGVPATVFGELAHKVTLDKEKDAVSEENGANAPLGALERIKRQRRQ